jgi:hypothetical protein
MSVNFSFRYIDDVLSLNNLQFKDYLHQIYPSELEIKETTDTPALASYLDLPQGSFLPSFIIICSVVSEDNIFEED